MVPALDLIDVDLVGARYALEIIADESQFLTPKPYRAPAGGRVIPCGEGAGSLPLRHYELCLQSAGQGAPHAARRRTSQTVTVMSSTDSASSQPPSIHWNGQNRLAGS